MPPTAIALFFCTGLAGGFIDAIAGGGGLITMPVLLACGFSPQIALGTNKFQSSCGTAIAVWRYFHAGLLRTPWLFLAVLLSFFASMAGALAVSSLDKDLLRKMLPWMLGGIAFYTALNPRFGKVQRAARISAAAFAIIFGLVIGFYDGFFGPGAGTFWTVACVALLGLDLRTATGYTKAANLASNLGSLGIFVLNHSVNYSAGAAMIAGQIIGARLGSGLVIKSGTRIIRPVFLCVVFALTAKLFWDVWTK